MSVQPANENRKRKSRERLGAFTDHQRLLQATSVCTVPDNKNFGVTLTLRQLFAVPTQIGYIKLIHVKEINVKRRGKTIDR